MWSGTEAHNLRRPAWMATRFVAKLSMASRRRSHEPQGYTIANVLAQVKMRNLCGERLRRR